MTDYVNRDIIIAVNLINPTTIVKEDCIRMSNTEGNDKRTNDNQKKKVGDGFLKKFFVFEEVGEDPEDTKNVSPESQGQAVVKVSPIMESLSTGEMSEDVLNENALRMVESTLERFQTNNKITQLEGIVKNMPQGATLENIQGMLSVMGIHADEILAQAKEMTSALESAERALAENVKTKGDKCMQEITNNQQQIQLIEEDAQNQIALIQQNCIEQTNGLREVIQTLQKNQEEGSKLYNGFKAAVKKQIEQITKSTNILKTKQEG